MIHTRLSRYIGFAAVGCGLIGTVIYALMISVTLAHIEAISGQVPFDMRPLGYDPSDAATLLDSLGADGREYYLSRQIPLDTLYPAILALTLSCAICWFGRRLPDRRLVHLGVAFAVGSAMFDYLENLGIVAMIHGWQDVSGSLVYAASAATIAKSVTTTLAVMLVLATGIIWGRLPKTDAHS